MYIQSSCVKQTATAFSLHCYRPCLFIDRSLAAYYVYICWRVTLRRRVTSLDVSVSVDVCHEHVALQLQMHTLLLLLLLLLMPMMRQVALCALTMLINCHCEALKPCLTTFVNLFVCCHLSFHRVIKTIRSQRTLYLHFHVNTRPFNRSNVSSLLFNSQPFGTLHAN